MAVGRPGKPKRAPAACPAWTKPAMISTCSEATSARDSALGIADLPGNYGSQFQSGKCERNLGPEVELLPIPVRQQGGGGSRGSWAAAQPCERSRANQERAHKGGGDAAQVDGP